MVSLTPDFTYKGTVDITRPGQVLPDEVKQRRAENATYAAEGLVSDNEIMLGFNGDAEKTLRSHVSVMKDVTSSQQRNSVVQNLVNSAAAERRDLSDLEIDFIQQLRETPNEDPDVILEKLYASRFVDEVVADQIVDTEEEDQYAGFKEGIIQGAKEGLTRKALIEAYKEEAQAEADAAGWGRLAWDVGSSMVPGVTWSNTHADAKGVESTGFMGSILPGDNTRDAIEYLNQAQSASEFNTRLRQIGDDMGSFSLQDKLTFIDRVHSGTNEDFFWDNLMIAGLDVASIIPVAKIATATKSAAKAVTTLGKGNAARMAAQGNIEGASRQAAVDRMTKHFQGVSTEGVTSRIDENVDDLLNVVPGLMNPEAFFRGSRGLEAERVSRMVKDATETNDSFLASISDGVNISRLPPEAVEAAFANTEARLRKRFNHVNDSVLDVRYVNPDSFGDVANVELRIGKRSDAVGNEVPMNTKVSGASNDNLPTNPRMSDVVSNASNVRGERVLPSNPGIVANDVSLRPANDTIPYGPAPDPSEVTVILGKPEALPFKSEENARLYAEDIYMMKPSTYGIEQEGNSFVITVKKSIVEDDPNVMDIRVETDYPKKGGFAQVLFGLVTSADNLKSAARLEETSAATFGGNAMMDRMSVAGQRISSLSKKERGRLSDLLGDAQRMTRDVMNPDGTIGKAYGYYYKSASEFQEAWLTKYNNIPSPEAVEAYYAYKQLSDFDYVMRNINVYKQKTRLGIEQHSFSMMTKGPEGDTITKLPYFEAKELDGLPPLGEGSFSIAYYDPKTKKANFVVADKMAGYQFKELSDFREGGYKVLQVFDPHHKELTEVFNTKGDPLNYILVRNTDVKPLDSKQIPYNEGGHIAYDSNEVFIKQANVHGTGTGRNVYTSDSTIHSFKVPKMGKKMAEAYEEARLMMNRGDKNLDAFVKKNLPYDGAKAFVKEFQRGNFSKDTPFVLTQSGQSAVDVVPLNRIPGVNEKVIIDERTNPHSLSSKLEVNFTQGRDAPLTTVSQMAKGTQQNPMMQINPSEIVDPLQTLGSSARDIAKSRHFDDLRIREMENWLERFKDIFEGDLPTIRSNPMEFLKNPRYVKGTTAAEKALAQNSRRAIMNSFNVKSDAALGFKYAQQFLANKIYDVAGMRGVELLDPILFNNKTDPIVAIKSVAFHLKLGMFNPVQLTLQASSLVTSMAIDGNPLRAVKATALYSAMRSRGLAEGSQKASKGISKNFAKASGIPEKDIDEAYYLYFKSGMYKNEGELAQAGDYLGGTELYDRTKKVLNASEFFFREGNNTHRGVSFALAYLRWKDMNPGVDILRSSKGLKEVIARADILSINMTKHSNAAWQGSNNIAAQIASLPTQFFAYQARLGDLMLGKRLTAQEKASVFAANFAFWGLGGATGSAVGLVLPVEDMFRQTMIDNGFDAKNAGPLASFLMYGGMGMVSRLFTEEGYDFSRYSPGGLSWATDLIAGDMSALVGAGPGTLKEVYETTQPFLTAMAYSMSDQEYPLVAEDFISVLKQAASVSSSIKAYMAVTSGEYLSKSGGVTYRADPGDLSRGIAAALGLTPVEITEAYLKINSVKAVQDAKREISNLAASEYERALKAFANGEIEQGEAFFNRAKAILETGDLSPKERGDLFKRVLGSNQTVTEQANDRYNKTVRGEFSL